MASARAVLILALTCLLLHTVIADGGAQKSVLKRVSRTVRSQYFNITTQPGERPFVIKLIKKKQLVTAYNILNGQEWKMIHISGIIAESKARYNPDWTFHLDPTSISFFSLPPNGCDSTASYVQEHLEEVGKTFLPGGAWCPSGSTLKAIAFKQERAQ